MEEFPPGHQPGERDPETGAPMHRDGVTGDALPINMGLSGLTGRTPPSHPLQIRAIEADSESEEPLVQQPGAMPGNCRRVFSSPLAAAAGGACLATCDGRQRDGGCLLDIVRAARAAGVEWRFEIDPVSGFWDYAGPPIPGYDQVRGDRPGALEPVWAAGRTEPSTTEPVDPPSYRCPHCATRVLQDPSNFHFWCPECGRNANDPPEAE